MASTVWRGYISFGLISIPVRLFRAARPERVSLRRLYREQPQGGTRETPDEEEQEPVRPVGRGAQKRSGTMAVMDAPVAAETQRPKVEPILAPVQQVSVRKGSDDVVRPEAVVKGYEYEKNRFVAFEPEELKSIVPQTSASMEIQEFVQLAEIDPVYFETSYYVTPEEAGEKAYALLYRSLQLTGLVAVAQFAMHGREHAIILRPGKKGLLGHTMFYAAEVRADEEHHADTSNLTAKELDLAQTLIHSLAAPFEPEKYRDTYRERLEALIAKKVAGQPIETAPVATKQAQVVDIAEALRRSLANLKKPPASAPEAEPAARQTAAPKAKKTARRASGR